jgi:hypothetical protein
MTNVPGINPEIDILEVELDKKEQPNRLLFCIFKVQTAVWAPVSKIAY